MKNILLLLFLLLYTYSSQSQSTIVGTLKHSITKENISSVNIYVESNINIGTVSNTNGDFIIKIPIEYADKNIIFSSIGFKKKILKIAELVRLDNPVIYMVSEITELQDVIVLSKYPNPKKILRKAINRISKNYINKPYQEDFFYRQINYRDDKVSRVVESSLTLLDEGYSKDLSKFKLYVSEFRKTSDLGFQSFTASLFRNLTTPMGSPHFVFNYDYVRGANTKVHGLSFRNNLLQTDSIFSVFKDFKISLENATILDDKIVYVILLKNERKGASTSIDSETIRKYIKEMKITEQKKNILLEKTSKSPNKKDSKKIQYFNTTRIYISSEDFAMLKIDTEIIRKVYTNNVLKKRGLLFQATTQYKKQNEKYKLNSIQALVVDFQKGDDIKGVPQFIEYEVLSSPNKQKNNLDIGNFSEIQAKNNLYDLNLPYNKEFWDTYNIIKMKSLNFNINETLFETDDLENIFIKD